MDHIRAKDVSPAEHVQSEDEERIRGDLDQTRHHEVEVVVPAQVCRV